MMNNLKDVQPLTFGAYRCAEPKAFRKALSELSIEERKKLAKQIANAKKKLANTRYADAVTYVRDGKIVHRCECKKAFMKENGSIDYNVGIGIDFSNLKTVIKQTLNWEKDAQRNANSFSMFNGLF